MRGLFRTGGREALVELLGLGFVAAAAVIVGLAGDVAWATITGTHASNEGGPV